MSAHSLLPLELRLELLKRTSNVMFDLLKRFDDSRSVSERYAERELDLHVHFVAGGRDICGLYAKRRDQADLSSEGLDVTVLVRDGEITKPPRPIASVVWLQPLNQCYMRGVETIQEPGDITTETIWRVLDRELRAVVAATGILGTQRVDQIVKSGPEIVEHFSGNDTEHERRTTRPPECAAYDTLACLRVDIQPNRVTFRADKLGDGLAQIRNVFFCPRDPDMSPIERMRHEITSFLAECSSGVER